MFVMLGLGIGYAIGIVVGVVTMCILRSGEDEEGKGDVSVWEDRV